MWIKKSSRKTSFCEKRTKVRKYKDSQLFDIKMWITLCKPISLHKYVTEEPDEKKVEK